MRPKPKSQSPEEDKQILAPAGVMPDKLLESKHMTNTEYQRVRESLGSQHEVAQRLGVDIRTVQRREAGEIIITFEATRALYCLSALECVRQLMEEVKDNGIKRGLNELVVLLDPWKPKAT
jgi:DNA-binding transcriptional regulator YiaG